jgi:hypothetical protein
MLSTKYADRYQLLYGAFFSLCVILNVALSSCSARAQEGFPPVAVESGPAVVYDYKAENCEKIDIPDTFLRAFRRYDGKVVALATHYINRPLIGNSLADLHHDCHVVYQGRNLSDPSTFDNQTWIAATWTEDGHTVTGVGHNEYHSDRFSGTCKFETEAQCWYNSIVLLHSTDGGMSFSRTDAGSPRPLIAAPFRNEVLQGRPRGYFDPSNIVTLGEYKYIMIAQRGISADTSGRCLLRSKTPESLDGWAMYDGHDFVPVAGSPYNGQQPQARCAPVTGLHGTLGSVVRIRGTDLFAAFSIDAINDEKQAGAIEVSFSKDLTHWSGNHVIMNLPAFWSKYCPGGYRYNYPSVVDDLDEGRNFDTIGKQAWLFLVRSQCAITMDRDLVRFRLTIGGAPTDGSGSHK